MVLVVVEAKIVLSVDGVTVVVVVESRDKVVSNVFVAVSVVVVKSIIITGSVVISTVVAGPEVVVSVIAA